MNITILVVDDEPHARRFIIELLEKDSEIDLLGECKNGREALAFINNKKPDIVFLDIQMPGINGMEVASKLKSLETLVIFTTAYDQYTLKAFEEEALDYLLKPFEEKRFYEVLNRAKDIIERNQQVQFSEKLIRVYQDYSNLKSTHLTEFIIKEKGLERKISVDDVVFIESSSVYVIIHTKKESALYRTALNLLEQQLPAGFLRVHRTYIINSSHIDNWSYLNNNTFLLKMSNSKDLISSRSYKSAIQDILSDQ